MRVRPRSPEQVSGTDQETTLRVWLLGVFRVAVGPRVIDDSAWRLRKARDLIKLLALAPEHRLHRERVIEALWSGVDLAAAGNSLSQILHFARHTLEPNLARRKLPAYLRLHDDIIVLAAFGQVHVDVTDFESVASAARSTKDRSAYRAALDLYAGDLLPDDVYDEWAAARRDGLQQLRQALRLELAGSYEEHGEFDQGLTVLGDVLAQDPLNEDAHAGLMRLHALSGDRHKALQQYERLEAVLKRELGVKPDTATQGLWEDIKTGRFLERAADVGQLEDAATDAVYRRRLSRARAPASKRAPETLSGNLPAPLTSFVGRGREVADIKAGLSQARLVTLLGAGGSGKTRLALRVAAEVATEFPDGVWFVDLAPLADPALVPRAVATVLGVKEQARRPLADTLVEYVKPQRMLLILDNCEQVTRACADLCIAVLQACPEVRVLTTTREALKVHGEMKWLVPPLALPEKQARPSLDVLSQYDAVQLFVERARLSRPTFRLTETNAAPALEICRRLDGLPLAIELTAARLNVLSLEEILDRLSGSLRLLTVDERGIPERHQTARSAIDWSYQLLTPAERILFDRLSAFAGGCALEAAEVVCSGGGIAADDILDLLSHLVDKSMVVVSEDDDGTVRYRLLETLREFGRDRLAASGESTRIRVEHSRYFRTFAENARPGLPGARSTAVYDRFERDHDNFRTALDWLVNSEDAQGGLHLAVALTGFWIMRGYFNEGRTALARILRMPAASPTNSMRGDALDAAGRLARVHADYAEARALFEEALAIHHELGDRGKAAGTLGHLGVVSWDQGDWSAARAFHEQSLAISRELGHERGIARALNNLGLAAQQQGDYPRAGSLYGEAYEMLKTLGDQYGIANTLNNRANVAHEQGQYETARAFHEEGLAIRRALGDRIGLAFSLSNLGNVLNDMGDAARARALYEESLTICRDLGARREMSNALNGLGNVAREAGDTAAAYAYYAECLSIRQSLGHTLGIAKSLESFVTLAAALGQPLRAVRLAGSAAVLREVLRIPQTPVSADESSRELQAIRSSVGESAYETAWQEGRTQSLEQAVADALRLKEAGTPRRLPTKAE